MSAKQQFVRDQHIVPRWHLGKFTDADGRLWCCRQNRPVKKFAPKGTCWERDFYEFELNGKKTNNIYGSGLGNENTVVVLSLTPGYLFVAAPPFTHWKSVGPPNFVDSVNLLVIQFAHKRVYSHVNSPEIQSLVDSQINKVEFGKNALLPASQNQN
jgi:hypothetical protein